MVTLFKRDNTGKMRMWHIEAVGDFLQIKHGYCGGTLVTKITPVKTNQSGRSIEAQVELEINSRVQTQLDKGYSAELEDAKKKNMTNALELPLPMLAQPISKIKTPLDMYFAQYKYDGMRCLIHNNGTETIAYSRGGKRIETINHILEGIDIPKGVTLDGELYLHGTPLQTIMSLAKRYQPSTQELFYVVYDTVSNDPYLTRLAMLNSLAFGKHIVVAPTSTLTVGASIGEELDSAKKLGYEGLILREPTAFYEVGKRSMSLIKVKSVMDDLFTIEDISASKDGWALLHCGTFSVTAPGTMQQKTEVYQQAHNYIGREIRVEFANYTRDGVPFHPVAVAFT